MAFKLFVSYSEKDRSRINPFLALINNMAEVANGSLKIFFYEENKTPCVKATDEILTEIDTTDAVLYFHSQNSVYSEYVQNEIGSAVMAGKQVIIAKLDKTPVKGMLQGVNYLDFYNPEVFNREMKTLIETISAKITQKQKQILVEVSHKQRTTPAAPVPTNTAIVAEDPYALQDLKMILGIIGIVTLAYIILKPSK